MDRVDFDYWNEIERNLAKGRAEWTDSLRCRAISRHAMRDSSALRTYGCTYAQALEFNGYRRLTERGTIVSRYRQHRKNAEARGIGWEFTLPEWVDVWKKSGHLAMRGRVTGAFVMARNGDTGPYSPTNVRIITHGDNVRESIALRFGPSP